MANKFRIGDRVEYNDPAYNNPAYAHGFGEVMQVLDYGSLYLVRTDVDPGPGMYYWERELTLAIRAKTPADYWDEGHAAGLDDGMDIAELVHQGKGGLDIYKVHAPTPNPYKED